MPFLQRVFQSRPQDYLPSCLLLTTVALGSWGCGSEPAQVEAARSAGGDRSLRVVTTFLPITSFTKAVVGDRAQVVQLLPPNLGPHDYQAKPEDVVKLQQADVLVQNGLGIESFLSSLLKNADNPTLKVIDTSAGIATLETAEAGSTGSQASDADGQADHRHEDQGPEDQAHGNHDHGAENPHIWLDPKRAIAQVETIRDGLVAADPAGKSIYTANAAAYIAKLKDLDAAFTAQMKPYQGKTFVTYHDFADYFADSYGLQVEYLVGIPHESATPQDVQRVITAARDSNLQTLLTEPQAEGNPFAALAQDLRVSVGTFDPIETGSPQALTPDYYLQRMQDNLKNLTRAFGRPTQRSSQGRFQQIQLERQPLATLNF
ncbi:metal ABC transporter solute-binding protein, Zn/Mn family [Lyngbya confervoides]|uniref:Zinc ABC transporter substrate-binding protein n=1 Tax=Lyngbya confervoides BDU141951 TaxID=1574623 RepID=A0ABD4T457_9CYAN|nr:zinc ABC transporter substrate-binding protein [Lyngbya confervoides]MCM1983220.1 zinc ABC transporter substrate-binding protein [Lyngbya confervoides BDU141951]